MILLVASLAVFCACSAAYCARVAMRHVAYKARWLRAVRLLEDLDVEMMTLSRANREMSRLAKITADGNGQLQEIHQRVLGELADAQEARLAAQRERSERAWAWMTRNR